jgi:hypothetical protein
VKEEETAFSRRGGGGFTGVGFLGADRRSRRGGSGVDVGRGRLRRPGRWDKAFRGTGGGRRKRPLPSSQPPPPLRDDSALRFSVLFSSLDASWAPCRCTLMYQTLQPKRRARTSTASCGGVQIEVPWLLGMG